MPIASIRAGSGPAPIPPIASPDTLPGRLPAEILARPVLVVEDESLIACMMESILEDMGFATILLAATAAEAAACARSSQPALVISDINLGAGGNALDALDDICQSDPVGVLFVTAHADAAARERIAASVQHYEILGKPVDGASLQAALVRLSWAPRAH